MTFCLSVWKLRKNSTLIDIVNQCKLSKMFSDWPVSFVSPMLDILKSPSQVRCIKMLVRRPIATVTSGHLEAGGEWERECREWECPAERCSDPQQQQHKHSVVVFLCNDTVFMIRVADNPFIKVSSLFSVCLARAQLIKALHDQSRPVHHGILRRPGRHTT